jgi:hypothetical protein
VDFPGFSQLWEAEAWSYFARIRWANDLFARIAESARVLEVLDRTGD